MVFIYPSDILPSCLKSASVKEFAVEPMWILNISVRAISSGSGM